MSVRDIADDARLNLDEIKTPELRTVIAAFNKNVSQAGFLSQFPLQMCLFGQRLKMAEIGASVALFGEPRYFGTFRVIPNDADEPTARRLRDELIQVGQLSRQILAGKAESPIPLHVSVGMGDLAEYVGDQMRDAYDTLMSLQLVLMWTAFETLVGDLWVKAVNAQPAHLAGLTGAGSRIERLAGGKPTPASESAPASDESGSEPDDNLYDPGEGKGVSLGEMSRATRGTYDLSKSMGDLLVSCERVKFTSLAAIRKAYSLAFSEKMRRARTDKIDAALADRGLDALSAVRNLIVHKAGVADAVYEDDCKSAPTAPRLSRGDALFLDGALCQTLIAPVLKSSAALVKAVDSWLTLTRR